MSDVKSIFQAMLAAFKDQMSKDFAGLSQQAKSLIENQLMDLSSNVLQIEEMKAAGELDDADAQTMLQTQAQAVEEQLLTLEGMSKIILQNAINAALDVARKAINNTLHWPAA